MLIEPWRNRRAARSQGATVPDVAGLASAMFGLDGLRCEALEATALDRAEYGVCPESYLVAVEFVFPGWEASWRLQNRVVAPDPVAWARVMIGLGVLADKAAGCAEVRLEATEPGHLGVGARD